MACKREQGGMQYRTLAHLEFSVQPNEVKSDHNRKTWPGAHPRFPRPLSDNKGVTFVFHN